MKNIIKLFLLISFLTVGIGPTFAKQAVYCGTNSYGNYYCTYDNGDYEYWNRQEEGNPYNGLPHYYHTNTTSNKSNGSNILDSINTTNQKDNYTKKCKQIFGVNSEYKLGGYLQFTSKGCECTTGYVLNSNGTACISKDNYCKSVLPNSSAKQEDTSHRKYNEYNATHYVTCICNEGYVLNDQSYVFNNSNACVPASNMCEGKYGYKTKSTSSSIGSYCECKNGYVWDDSYTSCVTRKRYKSDGGPTIRLRSDITLSIKTSPNN